MRSSRRLHTKCHTIVSVALSNRERKRERARVCFPSVWHSAFQVIGWLDVFRLLRQLTSGMRALEFCLCLVFFIHPFIWIPYPSLIQLIRSYFFCVSPHFNAQIIPDYSFHSIFASFVSPSCFCFIPLFLHLCPSIFFYPGLTVWKADVLVCKSQSDVWVKYG